MANICDNTLYVYSEDRQNIDTIINFFHNWPYAETEDGDTTSIPDFKTQEEIEEYFGEPISFTLDEYNYSEDYFWKYLEKWESIHKFKIIQGDEIWF